MTPRLLDHLVLPTADLSKARARLNALGFTVAPDGLHPFGTANCCVYFADGTFIEPLTVADPQAVQTAIDQQNMFVASDAAYRRIRGEEGFSAVVLKTEDAAADDAAFRREAISGGPMLYFERPSKDAAGNADIAAFHLAFAADVKSAEPYFFTCQRVRSPKIDRSTLERHGNGVTGIIGIKAQAHSPEDHVAFLSAFFDSNPTWPISDQTWRLGENSFILTQADGVPPGLQLSAVRFAVLDLDLTQRLFMDAKIAYEAGRNKLIVQPAAGQGATFIFEAN